MKKRKMPSLPLEGIRVIDLGAVWAISLAMKMLAILGAEVIHVESTKRPDITRFGDHANNDLSGKYWETGLRYNSLNLNKLGLTLDLSQPKGVQIFKELVKISDVVAEQFTPRVMKNLGLDYPILKEVKPDIIMLSLSGFGHQGPLANYKAFGTTTAVMDGMAYSTGYLGGPPIAFVAPYVDFPAAQCAALAVLAALEHRRRMGRGQWIDLSLYEIGVHSFAEAILDYTMNARIQSRVGNRHPSMAPHGCYRCKGSDKWVVIAISSDEEWKSLCDVLGNPPWTKEERFSDALSRWQNQDELDRLIEEWTIVRDHYEVMHLLQQAKVAAGAVLNCKELLLDPHIRERGYIQTVDFPKMEGVEQVGKRLHLGLPWKLSKTAVAPLRPSPMLGQHNHHILVGLLGLSEEEVKQLAQEGIIGTEPSAAKTEALPQHSLPLSVQKEQGRIEEYDPNFMDILGLR